MSRDAARIDALLPQTQCTRCGFAGCRPYAEAIAAGDAAINQCPPGGAATIRALADLLEQPFRALNPANGVEVAPRVAYIDEARCIGCARCLPPCPVDAIVGASKFLHTVVVERCTGCELCIAPCPVDCIDLRPAPAHAAAATAAAGTEAAADASRRQADLNRARYEAHTARTSRIAEARQRELSEKKAGARGAFIER